ncbi:MAG: T9SS type A sorting domain-containing protein [Lewinellaceae bacterium]|nr:T9SS type A sorting domain-containing protein [Lewinellaceae bacterium]
MKKLLLLLLLVAGLQGIASAGVFYEYYNIYCGSILELGPVGFPLWNPAKVIKEPLHGQALILTDQPFPDSLVYKSDYGYLGQDTFIVACAHATQITCDTGIYIISVTGCPPILSFTEEHEITCDSTLTITGLGFPTWVTPEIVQEPAHGTAGLFLDTTLWHTLKYVPEADFTGTDTIVVDCAHATQITCETGIYIVHVSCLNNVAGEKEGELRIFPNPAQEWILIDSPDPVERVRLYSLQGMLLREGAGKQVWTGNLPPGVYLLEVWAAGQRAVRKVSVAGRR